MRRAKGVAAIFAGLLLMFRAGAITAAADEGKGNNGDVKIHAVGTSTTDNRNEPHVCQFYIDGFKFDKQQSGTWTIVGQAPTTGAAGASGSWGPAGNDGSWHTGAMTLANGHYKLTVNTGKGDGKHKVFWVECGAAASGEANTPPSAPTQQNNGNNSNNSGERSDQPTNSKSKAGGSKSGTKSKSKKGGSATGTNSASKAASQASNGGSVPSLGNNASGTNSMQTVSREETTAGSGNNGNNVNTGTPATIPAGGVTLGSDTTVPTTTQITLSNGTVVPAGSTISLGATITLSNGTVLPAGVIPAGTTLTAGTVLPAGTTFPKVLGFQSAPMTGAVSPTVEQPVAVNATQTGVTGGTAVNGEETTPVAGITSLPSTSSLPDNGIWGALGLMLAGVGAFLLRKPSRRPN